MQIVLPWPPSSLSGHANGNRWAKSAVTAKHRAWAKAATLSEGPATGLPTAGDIRIIIAFYPPTPLTSARQGVISPANSCRLTGIKSVWSAIRDESERCVDCSSVARF